MTESQALAAGTEADFAERMKTRDPGPRNGMQGLNAETRIAIQAGIDVAARDLHTWPYNRAETARLYARADNALGRAHMIRRGGDFGCG